MLLDRWRARRAIATRSAPTPINDPADPRLFQAVEQVRAQAGALDSLGDPSWHYRWEGDLQLVGLDALTRSVSDVRQRLLRLVHECDLRHMPARRKRVLAIVLCEPRPGEGLAGWHVRLDDDQGEVGVADWRAARRRIAVLALEAGGGSQLFGGDQPVQQAVARWTESRACTPS
jgi:hypothetical protein